MKMFRCSEKNCDGHVDNNISTDLPVADIVAPGREMAFACDKCGRLHWVGGEPVYNGFGHKLFLSGRRVLCKN